MNLLDRLVAIWRKEQPGESLPDPKKGMERRTFLKILGGSAAVAAAVPLLDLEQLIWTPSTTIVVPEMGGIVTLDWMVREALRIFQQNLTVAKTFNRDYDARNYPARIGRGGITQQAYVGARVNYSDVMEGRQTVIRKYLRPMAARLAAEARDANPVRFGVLENPPLVESSVVTDKKTGVSIRGIKEYDVERDWDHLRLDVAMNA